MSDKEVRRVNTGRQTRFKNLTAKKAERGELEPSEEKELERITNLIAPTEAVEA